MATRTINAPITLPALTLAGTLQRPPKIDATLALPALALTATLQRPPGIAAELTLPTLDLAGTLSLPLKLDAPIVLPGLEISASIKIPIRKTLKALWTLSTRRVSGSAASWSLRLGMQHQAVWPVGNITADLVARWSGPLAWVHESRWASAPVIRATLRARWVCVPRVRAALACAWQNRPRGVIRHRFDALWRGAVRIQADRAACWALRSDERLCLNYEQKWRTSDQMRIAAAHTARWAAPSDRMLPLPPVSLTLSGQNVPISSCELRFDADSPTTTALVTPALWPDHLPPVGTEVLLLIDGIEWLMVLTSSDGQASAPVMVETSLQLASPCSRLENAEPVPLPFGGLASDIAAEAVAPLALTWSLPDWVLPPPLVATHLGTLSPLAVVKALAHAAGGLLLSLPSGDLLALPRQGGASNDLGCAIESERSVTTPQYAGVRVRAHDPGAEIRVDGEWPGIRTLDVSVLPWRPVTTRLFAGNDASLSAPVEVLRETTEQIQIMDGVAELTSPLAELVSTEWSDGSDRTLHWRGRWVWTDDPTFNGLCLVTYRYRILSLTARRTMPQDALAAVYEQEKT